MKVVFLAQGAFSSIGGIQRFNTRLIQSLSQISCDDVECEVEVMIRSDSTRDLPNNMPGVVMESFSGAAAGFAWRSLLSAVRAQRIILGHINFLPLAVLFRLLNPRASVYMIAHGIEVWGGLSSGRIAGGSLWLFESVLITYCRSVNLLPRK